MLLKHSLMTTYQPVTWKLFFFPKSVHLSGDVVLLRAFDRQRTDGDTVGLPPARVGRPFFLDEDGNSHIALNGFFSSGRMRNRSEGTNRKYAHSLGVWVNFLARRDAHWDSATEEDLLDYKYWRRTDDRNPRPVSGSTWSGDVVAIGTFYDWSRKTHNGPDLLATAAIRATRGWHTDRGTRGVMLKGSTIRGADVKWLSPAAFRKWRDVGIHGIAPNGSERVLWRPRCQTRDSAFVDGLYGSGLRLQEWASVLTTELAEPAPNRDYVTHRLADACAKGAHGHPFWLKRTVLDSIADYAETERAAAVRRAQASGMYERLLDVRVVDQPTLNGRVQITDADGTSRRSVDLGELNPNQRLSLFFRSDTGLEPLMLWLNEDGSPRPKRAWYKAFSSANARVRRSGIDRMECRPHMLRHSFALRWYAVGRLIWQQRNVGLETDHALDFRQQFGDAWSLVQTMLGHTSVETTKNIYLEPFLTLDVQLVMEYGLSELDSELLLQVLRSNPQVRLAEYPAEAS